MTRWAAWLWLVACSSAAPAPQQPVEISEVAATPRPIAPTWDPPLVARERPNVDVESLLPDLTEVTQWPLSISDHPQLEPRFPIAAELAMPGVGWVDLCSRGAQKRHVPGEQDQISYLAAWCLVANQDEDAAVTRLAPLVHSSVRGMPEAVRFDFASILLERGGADMAIHALVRARIDHVETLDVLAAFYEHLGRTADAQEINGHAIEIDPRPAEAVRCHRAARQIVLAAPVDREWALKAFQKTLEVPPGVKRIIDPVCDRIAKNLSCWVGALSAKSSTCVDYAIAQGIDLRRLHLFDAYFGWPTGPADVHSWWQVASRASEALPFESADVLAVTALESAIQIASCDSQHALDIGLKARRIRDVLASQPNTDASRGIDEKIAELIQRSDKLDAQCLASGRP